MKCASDIIFLNLNDFGNVSQYPGYPGYQVFAALDETHIEFYLKIRNRETNCNLSDIIQ